MISWGRTEKQHPERWRPASHNPQLTFKCVDGQLMKCPAFHVSSARTPVQQQCISSSYPILIRLSIPLEKNQKMGIIPSALTYPPTLTSNTERTFPIDTHIHSEQVPPCVVLRLCWYHPRVCRQIWSNRLNQVSAHFFVACCLLLHTMFGRVCALTTTVDRFVTSAVDRFVTSASYLEQRSNIEFALIVRALSSAN